MKLTNEAIAERLGWEAIPNGFTSDSEGNTYRVVLWKSPTGKTLAQVPLFKTDFTACFGPGGPWEWLKSRYEELSLVKQCDDSIFVSGFNILGFDKDGEPQIDEIEGSEQSTECMAACAAIMEVSGE